MQLQEKFIGFIDVLGFKKMLEAIASESGQPLSDLIDLVNFFGVPGLKKMAESCANGVKQSLSELIELLKTLGSPEDVLRFKRNGPRCCPKSKDHQRDLDFKITQSSDSVVVSAEVSPAGLINLVEHCWAVVLELLLERGVMCRGYITKDLIYHTDTYLYRNSPGYQTVRSKEPSVIAFKRQADERGTPFVEIDSVVCTYVEECEDGCVKKMFSRMVKDDGGVTALFPFKRLEHRFVIGWPGQKFNPEKEKRSNENVRFFIEKVKARVMDLVDKTNPKAVIKAEHYIRMLDAQLAACDKTDEAIDVFTR